MANPQINKGSQTHKKRRGGAGGRVFSVIFSDVFGIVVDSSDEENHGDIGANDGPVTGVHGSAIDFNALASGDLKGPSALLLDLDTDKGTMMAWLKLDAAQLSNISVRDYLGISGDGDNFLTITKQGANSIRYRVKAGGVFVAHDHTTYTSTDWVHIAMTWDWDAADLTAVCYLDGASVQTLSTLGNQFAVAPVAVGVGGNGSGGAVLDGIVDSAIMFNRVLDSTEISQHYNSGAGLAWADMSDAQKSGVVAAYMMNKALSTSISGFTIVDTDGQLTQKDGYLYVGDSVPSAGDPSVRMTDGLARITGRALVISKLFQTVGASAYGSIGWHDAAAASGTTNEHGFDQLFNSVLVRTGADALDVALSASVDDELDHVIVLRSNGAWSIIEEPSGGWMLAYVDNTLSDTPLYPLIGSSSSADDTAYGDIFVTDLQGDWLDDKGIATADLQGSRSAGDTFTHDANGIIEYTSVGTPAGNDRHRIFFRKQDNDNTLVLDQWWDGGAPGTSTFRLIRRVAGVETTLATTNPTQTGNDRIVLVFDGTTIKGVFNGALQWTQTVTQFETETGGEVEEVHSETGVHDLIAWPRRITGAAASELNSKITEARGSDFFLS